MSATHQVRLDLGEWALRAERVAAAAEQPVDRGEGDRQRQLEHCRAGQRVERQDHHERRVRQRPDVLVVGELLDGREAAVRDRAQRRREDCRELPGEGLVDDLERPDVVAAELARASEVERLDVRLPAFRGSSPALRLIGADGPELRSGLGHKAHLRGRPSRLLHHEVGEEHREDFALVGVARVEPELLLQLVTHGRPFRRSAIVLG